MDHPLAFSGPPGLGERLMLVRRGTLKMGLRCELYVAFWTWSLKAAEGKSERVQKGWEAVFLERQPEARLHTRETVTAVPAAVQLRKQWLLGQGR